MAKVTPEDFVAALEEWTVLDVVNAVKLMEEKLGISAAAPVAVAAAPAGAGAGDGAPPAEEQSEFTVVLTAAGDAKINVIKTVRELTGLGLKAAKDLVDGAPKPVKEGATKEEAESVAKKLQDAGASTEIR